VLSLGRREGVCCGQEMILAAISSSLCRPALHARARPLCCEAHDVQQALAAVRRRLAAAAGEGEEPRLVAVSKTKPVEALREAYDAGVRDFGENYVQELVSKAPQMPSDVRWRFIGKLQSNKAKVLSQARSIRCARPHICSAAHARSGPPPAQVPNLVAVETVDSLKLATRLDSALRALERPEPLAVLVQVNTSPWEGTKGGVLAEEAAELAAAVAADCKSLRVAGLMTIGAAGDTGCFAALAACREAVAARLAVPPESLELSMGMSGDFEEAARSGSTSVRVGSSIFGARDYSKAAR